MGSHALARLMASATPPDVGTPEPAREPPNGRLSVLDAFRLIREDMHDLEGRIGKRIDEFRNDFRRYEQDHEYRHALQQAENANAIKTLSERIHSQELDEARREGVMGVVRWGVTLAGRNWKLIVGIAIVIGFVLSDVHVRFGP